MDGGRGGSAVEEGEGAGVEAEAVEVAVELGQSGVERVGVVGAADLDLESLSLLGAGAVRAGVGPADKNVEPASTNSLFRLHRAPTIDDALQIGMDQQVWRRFVVDLLGHEPVAVLLPELRELRQQTREVHPAIRTYIGAWARGIGDEAKHVVGEDPDDDLVVDRVRGPHRCVGSKQAQVADVPQVITVRLRGWQQTSDHGLDNRAHTRVVQLVDQRVEVDRPGEHKSLPRLVDVVGRDRCGGGHRHLADDFVRQRVDQPRLPTGQLEGQFNRLGSELLPCVSGVLAVEVADLVTGEVSQAQRLHDDVERARPPKPGGVATGRGLVITEVAQAAQRH